MQTVWFETDSDRQKSNEEAAEDSGIWEDAHNQSVSSNQEPESVSAPLQTAGNSNSQEGDDGNKDANYFECDKCDFATASMDEIEDHAADAHGAFGAGKFKCDRCPYAASSYYDMAQHKENVKHATREAIQ